MEYLLDGIFEQHNSDIFVILPGCPKYIDFGT